MGAISLSGPWELQVEGERAWRAVQVPGSWESVGVPLDYPGPCVYRRRLDVPADLAGRRLFLRFGGVSYHCSVSVNGKPVGEHTGIWDAFAVEITRAVTPGEVAEIAVRVEKPASLTAGPGSPSVPGRYPLPETLAGFLPYVWGHAFGGIWQDVSLEDTGPARILEVHAKGDADGRIRVEVCLDAPLTVSLTLFAPTGEVIAEALGEACGPGSLLFAREMSVPDPKPWSPDSPTLYTLRLALPDGETRELRLGLRSLSTDGPTILLNGEPIYPRMALSWGWYPESLHSNPGPERVRADFERLRSLGFNGVKLCLWFPPDYYFDLADELGMLLWVELPMWMPRPTDDFRRQVAVEYERLLRQARNHPSVVVYSLGCELTKTVDGELLASLYSLARSLVGDALVRDNSGSGEAYGGLLNEHADYYDYHFYADRQFFKPLLDTFAPRWRPRQPFLFGEYCDKDTHRDLASLREALGGDPWWTSDDPKVNPQGARWQFDLPFQKERLREAGLADRGAWLEAVSRREALQHRRYTIEQTRLYREVSGYVVTGETDTPISTAGLWDETGRLKVDPAAFRSFNSDLVLLVGWDRRRAWIRGGDRAAPWDTFGYLGGDVIRPHFVVSHYGKARGQALLRWSASLPGEPPLAEELLSGRRWVAEECLTPFEVSPGEVRELRVAEILAPRESRPVRVELRASVRIGGEESENAWSLWVYPRDHWAEVPPFALFDPVGRLSDLPGIAPVDARGTAAESVVVATAWSDEVARHVEAGGRALLLQGDGTTGPIPVVALPFWREGVKLVEPHPAWGDFPHEWRVDNQFSGMATDLALDTRSLPTGSYRPILRRLDARTMAIHDYAAELAVGSGRLLVTTLRFEGGLGDQPLGISRNTSAAYLLSRWVTWLGAQRSS